MTISSYQIDTVIKAYTKQSKSAKPVKSPEVKNAGRYEDMVTLSGSRLYHEEKPEAFEKISYNLLDIILKAKGK